MQYTELFIGNNVFGLLGMNKFFISLFNVVLPGQIYLKHQKSARFLFSRLDLVIFWLLPIPIKNLIDYALQNC